MTSSLVGSEMCIRDRPKKVYDPTVDDPEVAGGVAGASGFAASRAPQKPVSYTHLTLPTICSV
eukprot:3067648-Prorocentrum_lima.AAC.1